MGRSRPGKGARAHTVTAVTQTPCITGRGSARWSWEGRGGAWKHSGQRTHKGTRHHLAHLRHVEEDCRRSGALGGAKTEERANLNLATAPTVTFLLLCRQTRLSSEKLGHKFYKPSRISPYAHEISQMREFKGNLCRQFCWAALASPLKHQHLSGA
jgi:hypothetical protein